MTRLVPAALLLLACTHAPLEHPKSEPPERMLAPEQVVRASLAAPPVVHPGDHGELLVALRIAAGYHVMSNQPSSTLYIATSVHFAARDGIAWGDASYPPPQGFRLADETIATFEGELEVRQPFEIAVDAKPAIVEVAGTLTYQSCTNSSCLFPVERPLTVRIEIGQ
jgi:DsbC/DsbD-like thiol-disulfide interchange protein